MSDLITREEADAMVAAAFERAQHTAQIAWDWPESEASSAPVCDAIAKLTPADARAALDKVREEARRVKPLVWEGAREGDKSARTVAATPFGDYEVLRWSGGSFGGTIPPHEPDMPGTEFGNLASIDEAKAACEEDFARRALSCLVPLPGEGE